jgi:hypothetical protein
MLTGANNQHSWIYFIPINQLDLAIDVCLSDASFKVA